MSAETSLPTGNLSASGDLLSGATNDPVFELLPKQVRVLEMNRGAERIFRDQEESKPDELWVGSAYDPSTPDVEDISVYLRLAEPMPVVAELMCAVIGRALKLPIPEPFIVAIQPGLLPESKLLNPHLPCLAFASLDVGGSTFSQLLRANSDSATAMLMKWEHLIPVTTFDEWVANRDRNLGNILFVSNVLWLIDHAEAFHGSSRGLFELAELVEQGSTNILGDRLARMSIPECARYLELAKQWLTDVACRVSIPEAVACAELDHWHSADQKTELINFLTQRLTLTHSLLCNRLRHPQLH